MGPAVQGIRLLVWILGAVLAVGCYRRGEAPVAAPTPAPKPEPLSAPVVAHTTPPATAPATASSTALTVATPAALDLFPRCETKGRFLLATDVDLPLGELADFANDAYLRFAGWLGIPADGHPESPVPVYLSSGVDKLFEVERRFGLPPSDASMRSFAFRGGIYPEVPLIVLPVQDHVLARWHLGHEIAHLAVSRVVAEPPDLVNEGLAELLTGWMHFGGQHTLREATSVHWMYERRLRRAVQEGQVPPLRDIFALDYWQFRADEDDFLYFALGWHFVRFLLEDRHPAVAGRFDLYLEELRAGRSGWEGFLFTYDAPQVEDLWRQELARSASWTPLFGSWSDTNGGFRGTARGLGSAALLHDGSPGPDTVFELSYEIDVPVTDLPPDAGIGFVLAHRGPTDYHLLSMVRGGREVVLYHHPSKREKRLYPKRPSNDHSSARVSLRIELDGSILLQVDGDETARFGPVPGARDGQVGLMAECLSTEPSSATEIDFQKIRARGWISRGPRVRVSTPLGRQQR